MARTFAERRLEERKVMLERYRKQLDSGGLIVREMTESERAYWDEHSAAADRKATPEQRERRDAARERRSRRAKGNA